MSRDNIRTLPKDEWESYFNEFSAEISARPDTQYYDGLRVPGQYLTWEIMSIRYNPESGELINEREGLSPDIDVPTSIEVLEEDGKLVSVLVRLANGHRRIIEVNRRSRPSSE